MIRLTDNAFFSRGFGGQIETEVESTCSGQESHIFNSTSLSTLKIIFCCCPLLKHALFIKYSTICRVALQASSDSFSMAEMVIYFLLYFIHLLEF